MGLKDIFKKPVNRPIEGVIKADDEASLRLEVEEYVLTNEVEKRLSHFLDAYNNYENANGVWISGFFGSGKSHLLKMLALLLENREIDGTPTLDLFLPKCADNEILRGDIRRAVAIPSKSILFNIDQKADVISKTQIDALLAVFVKVFDEMCGYYGKQGHIAQFERDLDSRELYEPFKKAYETLSGRPWQKGREQALLENMNIAKAYAQVTGEDEAVAKGILDKYRTQYRVSIEDFADQVKDYVDRRSPDFRLNFFVDEVGQYIADNVKLMTNLQTIAESLATKCRGQAWIIVTSQEDMNTVVGEMGHQQGNDFSKIQARLAIRMKLTSADVAEVIQKRLLMKNEDGIRQLTDIYHEEYNNFKTLFDFADGSITYRNFRDRDHFIHSYPFIPYQFALFQSAIQNLSQHSAFEGKHSSVGERSMLGVFQQVAVHISDHQVGQLATFDLMFEGIRTALKSGYQQSILKAEKHLDNPFSVRLLKALFLVKYVKEFKPTLRNLCVLMLEGFKRDIPRLRKEVEEALNLLEQQTYIQRNGELYEYLTDEEKDVEQEIKNVDVESTAVAAELEEIIFNHIIKSRKIRYDENDQDYPYSRKLDDHLYGREYELAIHVITPLHDNADNDKLLQMKSSASQNELLVILPPDERLVREILMHKRTEKYIRQNISTTQQETVLRILKVKELQNRDRYAQLKERIRHLLGRSKMMIAGSDPEIAVEEAQSRVVLGFQELITRAYPNLRMLRGVNYTEKLITKYLTDDQQVLFGGDDSSLSEAEQEVLAFIRRNNQSGLRTTLKSLLENFERKPYGWYYAAVLCILAKLCGRGKVDVKMDSNSLEEDDLERALRNTQAHGNLVLEPQIEFTASQVRALKGFYEDFFDDTAPAKEAKALGRETDVALKKQLERLETLKRESARYPFLNSLEPVLDKLKSVTGKPSTWYLTELHAHEDDLLQMKDTIIDPIQKFMHGPHKEIFDRAAEFVRNQRYNFEFIAGDDAAKVMDILENPDCFKGNHMQQVKSLVDSLRDRIAAQLTDELAAARGKVEDLRERLRGMDEFAGLLPDQQAELAKPFDQLSQDLAEQTLIAVIRNKMHDFEQIRYPELLARLDNWAHPAPPTPPPGVNQHIQTEKAKPAAPQHIQSRSIRVPFDKVWLADEADVDRYLEAMRAALLAEIREGKKIQI